MFENKLTFRSKQRTSYEEMLLFGPQCGDTTAQGVIDAKTGADRIRIPWRAICLALFLFIVGSVVIVISILILFGYIVNIQPNDGLLVLAFLGFVMFIPGFYHIRIAYYAYYRYDGYNFEDIPDFD